MKILRILAAMPLLVAGLMAADTVVTPEQIFPQLDGILKRAVAQSPRMISRAVDLEIAENDRLISRAALLPSVGGSYSHYEARDRRGDLPGSLDVTKVYYSLSVNQPIFHWGERKNTARMGEIRQKIAEGNYSEGYRLYAQEVRAAYFNLILSKIRAEKAAYYKNHTERTLKQGEERLAKKVISEAQMFGYRIEAERALITDERYAFQFETDKAAFSRLTGSPVLANEDIPDHVPPIVAQDDAINSLLAGFLAQKNPPTQEAENFRNAMAIQRLVLANQKTRLRPKFSLVAGVSQDEQSYSLNVAQKYEVQSLYGGVAVNWTLFDGLATRAAVRSALASVRNQEHEYRQLTERLAEQAQTQAKLVGFQARSVSVNDRLLESGEGNLRGKKEEFARGVISEEDVNTAQLSLYDSKITAYASRIEYYTQICLFLGTVMEDPVVKNLAVR